MGAKYNAVIFDMSEDEVKEIERQCIIHHLITEDFLKELHAMSPLTPRAEACGWTLKKYYETIGELADKGYNVMGVRKEIHRMLYPAQRRK